MKKTSMMIAVMFAFTMMATSVMGQTEQNLDVEIRVENYAALTVIDDEIILDLDDSEDVVSGFNDASEGNMAQLQLQANYLTNLRVTSGSGIMTTHHDYNMVETEGPEGVKLGAWPQISGPEVSGQSMFSWDPDNEEIVMDGLHRESDSGSGITPGEHEINVGISSNLGNTVDGEWAAPGTYNGALVVTVIDHQ